MPVKTPGDFYREDAPNPSQPVLAEPIVLAVVMRPRYEDVDYDTDPIGFSGSVNAVLEFGRFTKGGLPIWYLFTEDNVYEDHGVYELAGDPGNPPVHEALKRLAEWHKVLAVKSSTEITDGC
jgi:hypothetical protein